MSSTLQPHGLAPLMARAFAEWRTQNSIFDLPRRSLWRESSTVDLSVLLPGGRAATPLGPAAGPHTQMAQNLVLAWLAGARVMELKTVQVRDDLAIPRPCIDAAGPGFNVEWSQELPLARSLEQYVSAWLLIHALSAHGVVGPQPRGPATVFDASVGYDLKGIRSAGVARFLDQLADAGAVLRGLRESLPAQLHAWADIPVPSRVVSSVTLSTFHGCPAEEIGDIIEHLLRQHGMHVVVKLNPTLLGHDGVEGLLRGRLGYDTLQLDRAAFEADLDWDAALALFRRVRPVADSLGLSVGAKFTNTLVVRNHKGTLPGEVMYLSGRPLHVLAVTLAGRLAHAGLADMPLSLSGGVDAENVADCVACGFAPVTACTDLLQPNGYRRLVPYLRNLEHAVAASGARDLDGFILRRAGEAPAEGEAPRGPAVRSGAARNLCGYAASLAVNPRYHAAALPALPARSETQLSWLDCESCNKCLLVCPNDAIFSIETTPEVLDAPDLLSRDRWITEEPAVFEVKRERQWLVYADFCNECGNCDTFCPEAGGPYRRKPRVTHSKREFHVLAPGDAVLFEEAGARITARIQGETYTLIREIHEDVFSDGRIEARITRATGGMMPRTIARDGGGMLPLRRYHLLRVLRDGVLGRVNPVTAEFLAEAGVDV